MNEESGRRERERGEQGDAILAAAVAEGSREALAALFHRHADQVFHLAYRITGSAEEAEDVLQDVFVGLRRALERYEERGSFLSWLRKVAARTALMRIRVRQRRTFLPLDAVEGSLCTDPSPVVDRMEVREALAAMAEGQRTVFLLKEVEGYGHGEIAGLLGISESASRVRLHRAWRFLDRRLGVGP